MPTRCAWAGTDPLMVEYHDLEWGVPERDSRALWAKLVLDGFQAGLSWRTILHKREAFRRAFEDFDPVRIAAYDAEDVERLMADAGIVRSRSKIIAAIGNARAFLMMDAKGEEFSGFVWSFVGNTPMRVPRATDADIPAQSSQSLALSVALKKRGFKFVGPLIVYAWMQATGLVDDHVVGCFRVGHG